MPSFSDKWDKKEENEDYAYNNAYKYLKTLGERVNKLELEVKNLKYRSNLQDEDMKKLSLLVVSLNKQLNNR